MRFVEWLRRWREVSRLRGRLRRSPSPAAFGDLAERLIAFGDAEAALRVADDGLATFPDSERLAQVRLFVKRGPLNTRLRKLRDDLARRPTPSAYERLAETYRELGSVGDALATAEECAERYPLHESPHLVQGEIRLDRFRQDLIARDAVRAEQSLGRVARINARCVKAHLLLAELHWLVGDRTTCRRHLRAVLDVTPGARDVQDFLRGIAEGGADDDLDFAERARAVEERGSFAEAPEAFPGAAARPGPRTPARLDVEEFKLRMTDLAGARGVRNTIVLDRDGAILADASDGAGLTRGQFGELVATVATVSDDAGRRMDTGALVRAEVDSPSGHVTVARVRHLTVGILYGDPLRPEPVWEALQDAVARSLTGEAVRA